MDNKKKRRTVKCTSDELEVVFNTGTMQIKYVFDNRGAMLENERTYVGPEQNETVNNPEVKENGK